MSTNELKSLLVGHEERRLYSQGPQSNASAAANTHLSSLLSAATAEVFYMNGRKGGNDGKRNSGNNNGGKGKNSCGKIGEGSRNLGNSTDWGQGTGSVGNSNFNFGARGFEQGGYMQGVRQQYQSSHYHSGQTRDPQLSPGFFGPPGNFGPFAPGWPIPAHHITPQPSFP
ncbi:hypothetical protein CRG98_015802 [Punica granatum]|uniref:Uncharacterized protein n=1 Tax=Punica granatum TaxID=22663 RepID=A0A2I0K5J9_PUNGR|nr:hypothetical protein CRG98_015802 [Punica granatum]